MSSDFISGDDTGTTTLIALMKWTFSWGGVMHFKVGLWRVCGYKIDPYFNFPWLSTNLVALWSRFTFHYREFLVRAFYYPVFFRFFKKKCPSEDFLCHHGRRLFWKPCLGTYDRSRVLFWRRTQ
jgi:D-alanyl-lipoteichoic acid acyltransferase DltB (MBOAT superfamily)